ncbi:MAG: porin [Geminicoccaceae bacterium]
MLPFASANADEKTDQLQLRIDELEKELEGLRGDVDKANASADLSGHAPLEVKSGVDNVRLTLSGQVNVGVLVTDDGDDTDVFFVDNDNSSTRIRLGGDARFNEDITVGSLIEVQFESNSTADVSQDNQRNAGNNNFTERKLEVFAKSETYGRLALGQGDTSSNNSSEVDLSGTAVVGYSSVADFAGGIQFQEDGDLSGVTIGDTFSNLDGLSRDDRIRYDTPSFSGATLSASAIADDRFDIALSYERKLLGAHKFAAAIAYADVDDEFDQVSGSASILLGDIVKGANFTFAAGSQDSDVGGDNTATFVYGKIGYQFSPFTIGRTSLAIDYYYGDDIDQDGDESTSIGLLAVQNVDSVGTELFAGLRNFELDRKGEDFDDVDGLLVGARVKF